MEQELAELLDFTIEDGWVIFRDGSRLEALDTEIAMWHLLVTPQTHWGE